MTRAPSTPRGPRGFTLLEVMVAVAILGIAMVAIHHAQAQGIRAMARTKNMTLGTMLAWEKMNDILITIRNDFPRAGEERNGDFEVPYEHFHWVLRVEENPSIPEAFREKLPLLHLTVFWESEQPRGPESRSSSPGQARGGQKVEVWACVARL